MTDEPTKSPAKRSGDSQRRVWCAFHADGSDFVVFGRELEALRYATAHGMGVKPVEFGKSLIDQVQVSRPGLPADPSARAAGKARA